MYVRPVLDFLRRPGCSIPVNPYANPYSYTINDSGYNFLLSFVIVCFMVPLVLLAVLVCLICYHRMADHRFKTYVKILIMLGFVFLVSR